MVLALQVGGMFFHHKIRQHVLISLALSSRLHGIQYTITNLRRIEGGGDGSHHTVVPYGITSSEVPRGLNKGNCSWM